MVREKVWLEVALAIRRVGDRVGEGQNTETVVGLTTHIDGTECSETSAYKLQTPGNNPKESI